MIKSFFAIPSLVTMAGLAVVCAGVGCSEDAAGTATVANEPAAPADEEQKAPPKTPAPPPTSDDGDDDSDDEAPKTCMDTKPFDATTVPYHPPAVKAGSCTPADIKVFDDYMRNNPEASVDGVRETMTKQSKRCSECVFGAADDDKWAAIVLDATSATLNGGGCVSVVSGKDDCGKSYQQWNTCLNEVCAACSEQAEYTKCTDAAQQAEGPCGEASKSLLGACGNNVNDYLTTCFGNGLGAVVEQLCGSPAKDGGI